MTEKEALDYINQLDGKRILHKDLNSVSFNGLAVMYFLSENFIETFYDRFSPYILYGTQALSKKFLERHKNDIQIQSLINNKRIKADYIIDVYFDLLSENKLLSSCRIDNICHSHKLTIGQIYLLYPYIQDKKILYRTQKFDERFLLEHEEDKFYWKLINPQTLNLSMRFIEDFIIYVPFDELIKANKLPFDYIYYHINSLLTYKTHIFIENTKLPIIQLKKIREKIPQDKFLILLKQSLNSYKNNQTLSKIVYSRELLNFKKNKRIPMYLLNQLLE